MRFGRLEWSLHRVMGSLAAGRSEYSPLLLRIARQSVRANSLLRGMTQRMATANLFALSRDIMASLDSEGDDAATGLQAYTRDLRLHRGLRRRGGQARGARRLPQGPAAGRAGARGAAPALAYVLSSVSVPDVDSTLFVGCLVAGSLGAVMSVLIRLSGDSLDVDHQFGREYLTSLAALRPLIGAVFAVLLYFAFKGNLLKQVDVPGQGAGEFAFFVDLVLRRSASASASPSRSSARPRAPARGRRPRRRGRAGDRERRATT